MKQSSEPGTALLMRNLPRRNWIISRDSATNSLPRQFREHCRLAKTLHKNIPLAFTPSSSAARHSLRRAQPIGARGPIAYARRSRIGPSKSSPTRLIRSGPFTQVPTTPNQLRWDPLPIPEQETDFRRRHHYAWRQRRPGHANRRCHSSLRRQRLHATTDFSPAPTESCSSFRRWARSASTPSWASLKQRPAKSA